MTSRDIVLLATCAALIAALGAVPALPVGILPVPVTLQTMGVMLAGLLLGPVRGALACLLVIALVMLGLPVLSGGRGGLAVLAGPTAGFLVGWVPGALATGWIAGPARPRTERRWPAFARRLLAAIVGGMVVVYGCGIVWLAAVSGLRLSQAALGTLVFIPGDLLKAGLAAWAATELGHARLLDRT